MPKQPTFTCGAGRVTHESKYCARRIYVHHMLDVSASQCNKNEASLKFAILNPKNGFTVLISCVENQIDYHTCNSSTINHLPKPGGLPMAAEATNLCESVKPFPDRQSPDLS